MSHENKQQLTWFFVLSALALSVALALLRLQLPAWQIVPDAIHATLATWNTQAAERMQSLGYDTEKATLLSAMLLGQRGQLAWDIRNLYAQAGASHILALSGLHLSILLVIFQMILRQVLHKRLWRSLLTAVLLMLLWTYTLFTGCSPSLLRAAIMTTLWLLAQVMGAFGKPWHSFCIAASIILLFEPHALLSLSFQLSFTAVAGILLFFQPLQRQIPKVCQPLKGLWQGWCSSATALMGSAPLAAYYFHTFSASGLLLSPFYILLATGILYGGLLVFLLGHGASLVSWLIDAQQGLMQWANTIPGSTVDNLHPTPWQVILLYLGLLFLLPVLKALEPRTLDFPIYRLRRGLRQWPYVVAAAVCLLAAWLMP